MAMAILTKNGYDICEEIHKGPNSTTVTVLDADGEDHVVKIKLDSAHSKAHFMFQEHAILEKLKGHDVIIELRKLFTDESIDFFVFEYCKYHSLEAFLTSGFARHVHQKCIIRLCKQLCEALKFVHENGIIHGEIHLDNILVHNKSKRHAEEFFFDIKLAGFSRAIFVNRVSQIPSVKNLVNKPMFYSPERMEGTYCQAGDMWATGILLFQVSLGYMPYTGNNINELADSILNTEFDPRKDSEEEGPWFFTKHHPLDDFGKQLIGNMLQHKVEDRFTANECLEHTWLNNDRNPWAPLLSHLTEVKITTKHLKLLFHIGCILIAYLPKRTIDIVKDFQHIYLNKRAHNGKMHTSVEFQKIIEKFGGKLSTEQTKKLFNTFNAYENGVDENEILSAMAINYMCKNEDTKTRFCHHLEHMCDANHMLPCLFHLAAHHEIECDKEELTKQFDEVFSSDMVEIEQFTVELFGFHEGSRKMVTKEFDFESEEDLEISFDSQEERGPASYLRLSMNSITIDDNVICDDKIELIMEKQEKRGKRTLFEEEEGSGSESDSDDDNLCQKICGCCF